jgi:hypothetical protein
MTCNFVDIYQYLRRASHLATFFLSLRKRHNRLSCLRFNRYNNNNNNNNNGNDKKKNKLQVGCRQVVVVIVHTGTLTINSEV